MADGQNWIESGTESTQLISNLMAKGVNEFMSESTGLVEFKLQPE